MQWGSILEIRGLRASFCNLKVQEDVLRSQASKKIKQNTIFSNINYVQFTPSEICLLKRIVQTYQLPRRVHLCKLLAGCNVFLNNWLKLFFFSSFNKRFGMSRIICSRLFLEYLDLYFSYHFSKWNKISHWPRQSNIFCLHCRKCNLS